jgi:hypothetical protein
MGVILQLRDGTVKKCLFGRSDSGRRTKCGAVDCEHIECVIEDRKASARGMRLIMYFSPLGTLILLAALYFFVLEPDTVLITVGAAAVFVIMEIASLLVFRYTIRLNEDQVRELQEFREKGTVNGIPATQIHGT